MDAITALTTRRSVRKYKDAAIGQADLQTILECGRQAPSGVNRQPWKFIVVTDPTLKQRVAEATDYGKHIAQAAACVAVAVSADAVTPLEDASSATVNMLNAAHALGYGGCWIGAYRNDTSRRVAEVLGVPQGWEVMTLFALGVPDETPQKEKKPVSSVVCLNGFK